MEELIRKKKLIADLKGIKDILVAAGDPFLASVINRAIGCVENQPVLKECLVRCRECEHHKESPFSGLLQCTAEMGLYRHVLPDDYCIWGNETHEQTEGNDKFAKGTE